MKKKLKAQIKSRWYYVFWGTATVAVVSGQIYIGSGYFKMSETINSVTEPECLIYDDWRRRD